MGGTIKQSPLYQSRHRIGEHNIAALGMDRHNPVFIVFSILIVLLVAGFLAFPESNRHVFDAFKTVSTQNFDWLFLFAGKVIVLFCLLQLLPLPAVLLILILFVTSSDSGSLLIDSFTASGKLDAPVVQRIFWATTEGFVAAALLSGAVPVPWVLCRLLQ